MRRGSFSPDAALIELPGVGPATVRKLSDGLGVSTMWDLLSVVPHRYKQHERLAVGELVEGSIGVVEVEIISVHVDGRRSPSGVHVCSARVEDETGAVRAVWFNKPWVRSDLAKGRRLRILGKLGPKGMVVEEHIVLDGRQADAPRAKRIPAAIHIDAPVPVHPASADLSPRKIRTAVWLALRSLGRVDGPVRPRRRVQLGLPSAADAIRELHFPSSQAGAELARRALALDELTDWQLAIRRVVAGTDGRAPKIVSAEDVRTEWAEKLPFSLTAAQESCVSDILEDLSHCRPMRRVLVGDVGSGKTVVAAAATDSALRAGTQVAMLAPTELLARQHYRVLCETGGIAAANIQLLTGSTARGDRERIRKILARGTAGVVIGTHAILEPDISLPELGLAIVDEQHRFGVAQRESLLSKAQTGGVHYLQLSATPIPRTLAALGFGGLDISEMRGSGPMRREVSTRIVDKAPDGESYEVECAIASCLEEGRRAYVVCPVVTGGEDGSGETVSAESEAESLRVRFPDARVALVHGRIASEAKHEAMSRFAGGDVDILVATTVIEVGIDVPEATLMVVRDADRFGLAQLHQLRGRVGRGGQPGLCILEVGSDAATGRDGRKRLAALAATDDGFELAELDLKIRGAGEAMGLRQHGGHGSSFARFPDDEDLIPTAGDLAEEALHEAMAEPGSVVTNA